MGASSTIVGDDPLIGKMARGADKVKRKARASLTDAQKKVRARKIAVTKLQKSKRRLHSNNDAMARFIDSISGGGALSAAADNQARDTKSIMDEAPDSTEASIVLEAIQLMVQSLRRKGMGQ